jgi:hypothetical protein
MTLPDGLRARLEQLFPGARVVRCTALRDDESAGPTQIDGRAAEPMKALGYGRPLRVDLDSGKSVVFHMLRADDFGHDRRADRVGNLLLAYDTFGAW